MLLLLLLQLLLQLLQSLLMLLLLLIQLLLERAVRVVGSNRWRAWDTHSAVLK